MSANVESATSGAGAPPAVLVHLRYFAAAAEAAGSSAEDVALPAGATVSDLVARLTDAHGAALGRILTISSLLVDGETRVVADDGGTALTPSGAVHVDVLPPFAGG
ncbi:MoaD/ThiS family protein [Georgenia alba]|uniref:MoaD/ThiS family protein n=1 Tax=Georgenia alba TaxID=2233858 RepID=A0ABW2QC36_9MICO